MKYNLRHDVTYYNTKNKQCNLTMKPCWKYGASCEQCEVVTGYKPSSQRPEAVAPKNERVIVYIPTVTESELPDMPKNESPYVSECELPYASERELPVIPEKRIGFWKRLFQKLVRHN